MKEEKSLFVKSFRKCVANKEVLTTIYSDRFISVPYKPRSLFLVDSPELAEG
jgi:hypothetical protein